MMAAIRLPSVVKRKEIKIRKYAHVIEGHIIEFKPNKRKKAKKKSNRKSSI